MTTFEYILGDKFGQRFLTSQEFRMYADDLKLTETSFSDSLLAFLEQERLLVPICRVRYPAEIIRRWWQEDSPSLADLSLDSAHEEFIERHITAIPFRPWETFTVTAGQENGRPISENAVTSYYHYWQVFLLAESLRMGVSVLLDLRDDDVY